MKVWLEKLSGARGAELSACVWAFVYFFSLLAGYYVLRPIRDEMAIQVGRDQLHHLFTYVFLAMLVMVPLFGWITSRFARRQMLPWLYAFCALNLLGFYFFMQVGGQQSRLVASIFYVWLSVYNLFAISVFWSFMADILNTEQARRLYGFIAAGGTVGALTGPTITASLVGVLGPKLLMLVSAMFLLAAIVAILQLRRWAAAQVSALAARPGSAFNTPQNEPAALGGSIWSGILDLLRSPYLLGICLFLLCYSLLSTFLYFQQVELLPLSITDSAQRTRLLAGVDLAVNLATLAIQVLAFGTLIRRMGTTGMLVAMPVLSVIGFAAMAMSPVLLTLLVFGALRRAGEYAISKPARETLFNVLPADQKYKAKNVIDTLVHRGGDTLSSWLFNSLKNLRLTATDMSWLSAGLAVVWVLGALWLGRRADQLAVAAESGSRPNTIRSPRADPV